MTTLENIKSDLISHIMASGNKKLLSAMNNIFDATGERGVLPLTPEQVELLMMSEQDIENDRLISAEELDKSDSEWLS